MELKLKNAMNQYFDLHELKEKDFLFDNRNYCDLIVKQINEGIYDFIKQMVTKESRVLDLGGNIGYFSYFVSPLVKSVDAFEPTPETFRVLEKTIDLSRLDNVTIHKKAVSNIDGNTSFFVYDHNRTMNSLRELSGVSRREITVETISLSSIVEIYEEGFDFVKIDIEGGEKFLFEDERIGQNLTKIKNLFVEVHDFDGFGLEHNINKIIPILENNGFKVRRITYDGILATK